MSNDGQIGQTVAQVLAKEGAALGIAARSQKNVEARAKEIEATGAKVLALAVTSPLKPRSRSLSSACSLTTERSTSW